MKQLHKPRRLISPQSILFACVLYFIASQFWQTAYAKAIFYQPLNRDSVITQIQWDDLLERVYQEGFREIVIQWTRYGSTNFAIKENFLIDVLNIAESKKLKVWLGLYLPDDYYQVMENNKVASPQYFKSVLAQNRKQLSLLEIKSLVNTGSVAGWYLPLELTNQYLNRTQDKNHESVIELLRDFVSSVDDDIAISYFLSQSTSFKSAYFDTALLSSMGFDLWIQKSNGIKTQTVANKLIENMDCKISVISEIFEQTSDNNAPFKAQKSTSNISQDKRRNQPIVFQ